MAQFETWLRSDLSHILQVQKLDGVVFSEDSKGNLIGVEVFNKGQKVTLSGTVTGYILKANDETVVVTGTASANKASIVLPSNAYDAPGPIYIVLKLATGSGSNTVRTTLCACQTHVRRSSTGNIVTPEYKILDLETLLTKISEMETKTAAANTAANNANAKATAANNAATSANSAASSANTAATRANTAAEKLEGITADAETRSPGTGATAAVSEVSGHYHLHVGVEKGDKGDRGEIGPEPTVTNTVVTYQESASSAAPPSGTWQNAIPQPLTQGYFLWIKTEKTWSNGQTSIEYSLSRQGVDGSGAVSTVSVGSGSPISPDANGNITLPSDETPTENSSNIVSSGGVASAISEVADDVTDLTTRVGAAESDLVMLAKRQSATGTFNATADEYISVLTDRTFNARRVGMMLVVHITFVLSGSNTTSGFTAIGALPSNLRPEISYYQNIPIQGTSSMVALRITSSGELQMHRLSTDTGWVRTVISVPLLPSLL